ncbi:hypothetical protein O7632_02715 [Solwaraspora sp. WMMD406]|uniref:hypothetical protein n=1 Tax=Solwaraspora sp. WMMD406 TaxID=3016095 RepID=UPI0024174579|nr:hypothetical protein [Solwaraspora sp. WMMD406]MDG4763030.1 hypothetical protein [Solwaraspora sp. WMMD406]
MISIAELVRRAGDSDALPLVTISEFFDGNDEEGSIAPNQWEYGRPPLAELADRFRDIERREDVAWVRVQLHPETLETDELAGEAVAICTSADEPTCESWVDGLESSGIMAGLVDDFVDVPPVPAGMSIWSVTWD